MINDAEKKGEVWTRSWDSTPLPLANGAALSPAAQTGALPGPPALPPAYVRSWQAPGERARPGRSPVHAHGTSRYIAASKSTWLACALPRDAAASKLTWAAFAAGAGSARRSRATTKRRESARAGHLPAPAVPAAAAAAAAAARRLRSARAEIGALGVLAADRRLAAPPAMARCWASIAPIADLRAASAAAEPTPCLGSVVWIGALLVQ